MIFLFGGLLVAIVIIAFIYPIIGHKSGDLTRNDSALAMLHDQLGELDRDLARGVIAKGEERAARLEIQRRIIAVGVPSGTDRVQGQGGGAVMMMAAAIVPVAAAALYFNLGSPQIPSVSFADRTEEIASKTEVETLTRQLREKLLSDENGGPADGWILLGETYMRMERYADAADAFGHLVERADAASGVFSRYAEALVMDEGGTVTPRAERALDEALVRDSSNPAGTYYKAMALEQSGALTAAHAKLAARLATADGYYPWMESYIGLANFIAPEIGEVPLSLADYAPVLRGPSAEDVANAADLTHEGRGAFIASMVERLAARLVDEPNDLDGWLQLARAYTVLGQTGDARNAYDQAAGLIGDLAETDPRRAQVADGLAASE